MAESTPPAPTENDTAYWIALGRFVQAYATTEADMQILLWDRAQVTDDVARAIFSGVRIKEAINQVKRIHQALGTADCLEIMEATFQQLSVITKVRNDILHFGAKFEDGRPSYVTNQRLALTPERTTHFPISREILERLTTDLVLIKTRIELFRMYGSYPGGMNQEEIRQFFAMPWRYTHAPLTARRDTRPAPHPEREDPPESSQE